MRILFCEELEAVEGLSRGARCESFLSERRKGVPRDDESDDCIESSCARGCTIPISRGVTLLILAAASLRDVNMAEDTVEVFQGRLLYQVDTESEDPEDHLGVCLVYLFPLH